MRGVRNRVYFLVVYSSEASDAESMRGIHDARFICIDVISTSERVEKADVEAFKAAFAPFDPSF